jgi:L-rhamnose-H+ transport protein
VQVILGVLFHFIGGFASASFYLPLKKVRGWHWESYWLVGGIASWLIVPWLAAWLTVPHFTAIIADAGFATLLWTWLLGVLWGIGGLTYGLSMRYLGLSLGMSVTLGFCSAFGALIPPLYRDMANVPGERLSVMLGQPGGQLVVLGVIVCLAGIAFCGRAGMLKEAELSDEASKASIKEFNLRRGLVVATVSGILSACFNFGLEAGQPMAAAAVAHGANPLFQNNVVFVVVLLGGLTSNLVGCLFLNARNRSFGDYTDRATPLLGNYLFAIVAGTTWFLQFFFYGMGASKLSNGSASWILHMAFIIALGNLWGLLLKEWKGASARTMRVVAVGILLLLVSVVVVGYANAL